MKYSYKHDMLIDSIISLVEKQKLLEKNYESISLQEDYEKEKCRFVFNLDSVITEIVDEKINSNDI